MLRSGGAAAAAIWQRTARDCISKSRQGRLNHVHHEPDHGNPGLVVLFDCQELACPWARTNHPNAPGHSAPLLVSLTQPRSRQTTAGQVPTADGHLSRVLQRPGRAIRCPPLRKPNIISGRVGAVPASFSRREERKAVCWAKCLRSHPYRSHPKIMPISCLKGLKGPGSRELCIPGPFCNCPSPKDWGDRM